MRARARTITLTAIGAAIGLALAATMAIAPASAAKPAPAPAPPQHNCAYFAGLTVTANTVSVSSVGLKAGEVIGVTVSPARVGDTIIVSSGSSGMITFQDAPATSGLNFRAPADGVYGLGWSLEVSGTRPSSLTWSFTCSTGSGSSGGTSDADRDGVADAADKCAATVLPDAVSRPVAGRYYALSSGRFVDGTGAFSGTTVIDTGGCSATQISKALGLRKADSQAGISLSVLSNWAATH